MGIGKSQPIGLALDDKPILANNFYTIRNATYGNPPDNRATVFEGQVDSNDDSAVDRFAKNLMIHRHPNIIRFIATWKTGDNIYLATEEVKPLQHVIKDLTALQICVGLNSILKAIEFLHIKSNSSHNNICQSSIFVTPEGHWKLGAFEFLCRFSELTISFLSKSRKGRYIKAFSSDEETRIPQPSTAIDIFAFGVLVQEILASKLEEEVPGMADFYQIAKNKLQATDPKARPTSDTLLSHDFFNHQFLSIHNFLTELSLKTDEEKQFFFREVNSKLCGYSEKVVAAQLGSLLLSRMVLLDSTAQKYLLPQVLIPKTGIDSNLFCEQTYKNYIIPKLLSIFCVRDIQVRMTLLTYFKFYCKMFTDKELQMRILPELLVGVKDTNDELVALTLKALSNLVPILGSETVIGGKRAKLFSDGRPKVRSRKKKETDYEKNMYLSERPSPDGGEANSNQTSEDETEPWDSWDKSPQEEPEILIETQIPEQPILVVDEVIKKSSDKVMLNEKSKSKEDEPDFFRDMEPVISKTHIIQLQDSSTFDIPYESNDEATGEGWGEDNLEWANISENSETESKTT